ncbi:hypothetical protein SLE2022_042960 [Rubroshorea leprosula]
MVFIFSSPVLFIRVTFFSSNVIDWTKPSMWLTIINDFFNLPNPRIFALFMTSSAITFSLGVAMVVHWALYGCHHPRFHWLVYYAPLLIALPILIWVISFLFAILIHSPPLPGLSSEPMQAQRDDRETDAEEMVQEEEERLDLATVKIGINDGDHPSIKTETQILKRALSLPRPRISAENREFKRSLSFRC